MVPNLSTVPRPMDKKSLRPTDRVSVQQKNAKDNGSALNPERINAIRWLYIVNIQIKSQ
ncbi:hypothetical protein J6590_054478 [Homalodisca vitripennis]|nr:hypothetical protein J6590_054478 [Homalodisca vitripennis]